MKEKYNFDIYFKSLIKIIKKTKNFHTYYLPHPYKSGDVRDHKKNKNLFNFKKIFDKDYLIHNKIEFSKSKVFFLSHYLGHEHNRDEDFYYGNIFSILKKNNINYSILMINKSGYQLDDIKKKFYNTVHSRVYINEYSHPLKDIKLIYDLSINYFKFYFYKKKIKFNRIEKKILSNKFSFLNFIRARTTLKLFNNIENVLRDLKYDLNSFVFTFEGHAFERMIIEKCKKKKIKTIGYFFSVIRQDKTNIFYKFPKFLMPDQIFTTGNVIKKYFKKNSVNNNICTVGSGRTFLKKKFNYKKLIHLKKINVLLCPEGLYSETNLLVDLGKNLSLISKSINFKIRIHPELSSNLKYMNNLSNEIKNFKNLRVSNNSLEQDIKNNQIIVYRGSSVCVNGVLGGVIPIYFRLPNEISIDPLFEINQFEAENEKEIIKLIDFFRQSENIHNLKRNMETLRKYCSGYFQEFDKQNILKYLKNDFNKSRIKNK